MLENSKNYFFPFHLFKIKYTIQKWRVLFDFLSCIQWNEPDISINVNVKNAKFKNQFAPVFTPL